MKRSAVVALGLLSVAACQESPLEPLGRTAIQPLVDAPLFAKGGNGNGIGFDFDPVEQKFFWIGYLAPEGDVRYCDVHYFVPQGNEGGLQTFKDGSKHLRASDAPVERIRLVHQGEEYWSDAEDSGSWSASLWFTAGDRVTRGHLLWTGAVTSASTGERAVGICDLNIAGGGFFSRADISVR